jgi:putative Holliday junction resolvase
MTLIACDVGSVRIGLARSAGSLAVPVDAVPAGEDAFTAVERLVHETDASTVYVGLPLRLAGDEGPAAQAAREWAEELSQRVGVPVRLIDERLSTVQAQRGLHAGGRSTKQSRSLIDSASAVVILQAVLDWAPGSEPGERVGGPA